jgi:hypothetical protein
MINSIEIFLDDLEDFDLRHDYEEETVEDCDCVQDLLFEIEVVLYNEALNNIIDLKSEEYLSIVSGYYILKSNSNKVYLTEFLPMIYKTENEWRMYGDEKIDEDEFDEYE